ESPALKIKSPFFSNNNRFKDKLVGDLTAKKLNIVKASLNTIHKPSFINEPLNFENKLFLERAKELDISKDDNFGISKKIPLENPDWQFEEQD
ncbi:MAG: hypothetical protein ACFFD7_02665, partial [Candidatus Thorarchaeota archaeon]